MSSRNVPSTQWSKRRSRGGAAQRCSLSGRRANRRRTGITQYPGAGKMHSVTIAPETGVPVDNKGGGYLAPYMKFSGFDAIEVQGKAEEDVIIFIDGDEGLVRIETAPEEPNNSIDLPEILHEMYSHGGNDRTVSYTHLT